MFSAIEAKLRDPAVGESAGPGGHARGSREETDTQYKSRGLPAPVGDGARRGDLGASLLYGLE